ncbi:putative transporter [Alloprevotella tannerae]|uniref:putative transporter n=1 Tax=Alloprevotella tannerae TaxID=76122 RepID=UPI0028EBBC38|nr:putative transporter [Alloprevotella tannerae]
MGWINDILYNQDSVAHTIGLYAVVISLGILLGKIKIRGFSFGMTIVLFIAILMGHLGFRINQQVLLFMRDFGLLIFVYTVGLQMGSSFFSSFRQSGIRLNVLAIFVVLLNLIVLFTIYFFNSDKTSIFQLVGIMSGAVTCTPGLGAAQQVLQEAPGDYAQTISQMTMGYAASYPVTIIASVLVMALIKLIFHINPADEQAAVEKEEADAHVEPFIGTFKLTNTLIDGITVSKLHNVYDHDYVVSRILKPDGQILIPGYDTQIGVNDLLLVVMAPEDVEAFRQIVGPVVERNWDKEPGKVVSRNILISNPKINGKQLGALRIRNGYGLNATRVTRAGVSLLASRHLTLQVGDKLTVVGREADVDHLAGRLGNSQKHLRQPNMFTFFFGILLGIILGSVPIAFPGMAMPLRLGLSGGPLIIAILISRYGYKLKLVSYTSTSAALMIREFGMCIFLASVGFAAGPKFVESVFSANGAQWVFWGFLITTIPLVVVATYARIKYKINYFTILGFICGAYTDAPALAYADSEGNNDAALVAYSTVYPLITFLRVLCAQFIVLAFLAV